MKRRHFLQFTASTVATLALSQGQHLHRALAQTTGRKLALLVGVNQYPTAVSSLGGCLNDVRLQYELLVHRYGFDPQDIAIVADSTLELPTPNAIVRPTRQAILDAFQTHLIDRAQPGDAVIFHYSGHGTYVRDPHPIQYAREDDAPGEGKFQNRQGNNGVLVPSDILEGIGEGEANVIMGSTLFLLRHALKTDNVTFILDCCYSGGGVRGNLVYRATRLGDGDTPKMPSPAELDFQEQLIAQLGLTRDRVQEMRQSGMTKGIVMTSASATQLAAESTIADFRAGIFTYLLTRYLWQADANATRSLSGAFLDLSRIANALAVEIGGKQDPIYFVGSGSDLDAQPPYLLSAATPAADAVVRSILPDGTLEYWLGGMTPYGLEQTESIFELIDNGGKVLGQVSQTRRDGLRGYGKLLTPSVTAQPGMLMRERIRGIPTDLKLRLGLHDSLREAATDARRMLPDFEFIEVVEVNGQTETDYLLGRFDAATQRGQNSETIADGSIGLFDNSLDPLPITFGTPYETMGETIERLSTRLRLLLGTRRVRSLLNPEATPLNVTLEVNSNLRGGVGSVSSRFQGSGSESTSATVQMQLGEEMSLKIVNREARGLYIAVLGVERAGNMHIYYPSNWTSPEIDAYVEPQESIDIPSSDDPFYLPMEGPTGYFEVLVIASADPLRATLQSVQRSLGRAVGRGIVSFTEDEERSRDPQDSILSILNALFDDFDRNSSASPKPRQTNVNLATLAAFSTTIEVTAASF